MIKLEEVLRRSAKEVIPSSRVSLARRLVRRREKSSSICANIREAWLQIGERLATVAPSLQFTEKAQCPKTGRGWRTGRNGRQVPWPACIWVTSHPRALRGTRPALRAWHGSARSASALNSALLTGSRLLAWKSEAAGMTGMLLCRTGKHD